MPIDEEQPDAALEISKETERTIQGQLASSGVAGALSLIPGVGSAINEMMTQLAIKRTNERIKELFEHFANKVRYIGEEKVDREWFRSEEFQTLLYEALQQLHVTHDRQKIEMLGAALANSGTEGFKDEDRKDLFIRFVRDLTQHHLKVLLRLAPEALPMPAVPRHPNTEPLDEESARSLRSHWRPTIHPNQDDELMALQMLHASGLVEENIKSSIEQPSLPSRFTSESQIRDAVERFSKSVEHPTITRTFRLSPLGDAFLKFMDLPKKPFTANPTGAS
jgi:hypothetical protein